MKLRARERMGDMARRAMAGVTKMGGTTALGQVRGMKTKSSVKRLCDGCKVGYTISEWPQLSTGRGLYLGLCANGLE